MVKSFTGVSSHSVKDEYTSCSFVKTSAVLTYILSHFLISDKISIRTELAECETVPFLLAKNIRCILLLMDPYTRICARALHIVSGVSTNLLFIFPAPNSNFHPFFPKLHFPRLEPWIIARLSMSNTLLDEKYGLYRVLHPLLCWMTGQTYSIFLFYPPPAKSGQTLDCNARWRSRCPKTTPLRVSFLSDSHRL